MTNFWKRWHITLTQWFVDYVYIPLLRGFRNRNAFARAFSILVTMLLIGLWHGANWTFVFLGVFDGIILIIERFWWKRKSNTLGRFLDNIPYAASFLYFFLVVTVHNILFRAEDMDQAKQYFNSIAQFGTVGEISLKLDLWIMCFLCLMVVAELLTRKKTFPLAGLDKVMVGPLRWSAYYMLIFLILRFSVGKDPFIYFQF
jgi:D-alanyl-lipoteichoic acid acyltransferase DltB (MBOAT superfamily)